MLDSPVFSFLVSLIPAAVKVVLGHEFYLTGPSKIPVFRAFFFDQVRFCLDHLRLFFQMAKPGSYLDFLASSRQKRQVNELALECTIGWGLLYGELCWRDNLKIA